MPDDIKQPWMNENCVGSDAAKVATASSKSANCCCSNGNDKGAGN